MTGRQPLTFQGHMSSLPRRSCGTPQPCGQVPCSLNQGAQRPAPHLPTNAFSLPISPFCSSPAVPILHMSRFAAPLLCSPRCNAAASAAASGAFRWLVLPPCSVEAPGPLLRCLTRPGLPHCDSAARHTCKRSPSGQVVCRAGRGGPFDRSDGGGSGRWWGGRREPVALCASQFFPNSLQGSRRLAHGSYAEPLHEAPRF